MNNGSVTRQDLQELESRLREHTAQAVQDSETRLREHTAQAIHDSETRLLSFMEAMEARLRQHTAQAVHESETRLLTAFHKFAERHDARWTAARILATDAQLSIEELRQRLQDKGLI